MDDEVAGCWGPPGLGRTASSKARSGSERDAQLDGWRIGPLPKLGRGRGKGISEFGDDCKVLSVLVVVVSMVFVWFILLFR